MKEKRICPPSYLLKTKFEHRGVIIHANKDLHHSIAVNPVWRFSIQSHRGVVFNCLDKAIAYIDKRISEGYEFDAPPKSVVVR